MLNTILYLVGVLGVTSFLSSLIYFPYWKLNRFHKKQLKENQQKIDCGWSEIQPFLPPIDSPKWTEDRYNNFRTSKEVSIVEVVVSSLKIKEYMSLSILKPSI